MSSSCTTVSKSRIDSCQQVVQTAWTCSLNLFLCKRNRRWIVHRKLNDSTRLNNRRNLCNVSQQPVRTGSRIFDQFRRCLKPCFFRGQQRSLHAGCLRWNKVCLKSAANVEHFFCRNSDLIKLQQSVIKHCWRWLANAQLMRKNAGVWWENLMNGRQNALFSQCLLYLSQRERLAVRQNSLSNAVG